MTQEQAGGLAPEFTIADRLRLARELKRYTQDELAALIDSTRSTIRNYENRDYLSKRKAIVLKRWSLATEVSLEWLETGGGAGSPGGPDGGGVDGTALAKLTAQRRSRAQGSPATRAYPEAA